MQHAKEGERVHEGEMVAIEATVYTDPVGMVVGPVTGLMGFVPWLCPILLLSRKWSDLTMLVTVGAAAGIRGTAGPSDNII